MEGGGTHERVHGVVSLSSGLKDRNKSFKFLVKYDTIKKKEKIL